MFRSFTLHTLRTYHSHLSPGDTKTTIKPPSTQELWGDVIMAEPRPSLLPPEGILSYFIRYG